MRMSRKIVLTARVLIVTLLTIVLLRAIFNPPSSREASQEMTPESMKVEAQQNQDDLLDLLSEIQDIQRSCTTKIAAYYHILEAGGSPEDLSNLANTIVSLSWDVRYDLLRLKISKKFSGEIREACADGIEAFADASVFRVVEFEYRVKELDLARVSNRTKIASNRHQAELLEAKANNCIASIVVAEGDIE